MIPEIKKQITVIKLVETIAVIYLKITVINIKG